MVYGSTPKWCPAQVLKRLIEAMGIEEGPIFQNIRKGGHSTGKALTSHSVGLIVKRYAETAGFNPKNFGGHSLRTGCASYVIEKCSLPVAQKQLRHKNPATTSWYNRNETAKALKVPAGTLAQKPTV